ncbi:MAG TPA: transglutaminaseTgpA domain-containing protein [Acidimicrobiales bacterium]|nr:transglutaminaseTgpA domain-containing protein [Acidimicrobiales bacterium]
MSVAAGGRPASSTGTGTGTGIVFELAAATALACLTLLALPGTRGILGSGRSLWPVVAAALTMHALAWACRRRLGPVGFLVALAGPILLVGWLALPDTTVFGLPWTGTWRAAAAGMRRVLDALATGAAPAADEPETLQQGRLALAVACVAVFALVADQAAFRMRRAVLALVPSFTLVLLGATRAPSDEPGRAVAAYLLAAMAFLLVHHTMAFRATRVNVGGRAPFRLTSLMPAGAGLAALAVGLAMVVAPRLPGYGEPAIVAQTGSVLAQQGRGVELSSFVDLNPMLTERSDLTMFTVESSVASYWRLTSLDRFDGRTWTSGPAGKAGPGDTGATYGRNVEAIQSFRIENLRSEWLPAAYRPQRVRGTGEYIVTADPATVRLKGGARFGQRYEVASVIPRFDASELQQARATPPATLRRYLELPDNLPQRVADEAVRVAGATSPPQPYAAAMALQTYFRGDGFTYDLAAPSGRGDDALVRFLFRTRRGYCEQFAGAFAVMARVVGLPTRVAVGFTHGEVGQDGRYEVRGLNAHAWPEVYLQGAGWVAFEPTPGRGIPGGEAYTGLGAVQATRRFGLAEPEPLPTQPSPTTPTSQTTVTTVPSSVATTPSSVPSPTPRPGRRPRSVGDGRGAPVVPVTVAALALFAMTGAPLVRRARRRARRRHAGGANDLVLVAWAEAAEALAESGMGRRPSETMLAHAARAVEDDRLPAPLAVPVLVLAGRAGTASYSGREVSEHEVVESRLAAETIERTLNRARPLHRRLGRLVSPSTLWRQPPR